MSKSHPRVSVSVNEMKGKRKIGEIRVSKSTGRRRIFDGRYWQSLCSGDPNCLLQAKTTCRLHREATEDDSNEEISVKGKNRSMTICQTENRRTTSPKLTRWSLPPSISRTARGRSVRNGDEKNEAEAKDRQLRKAISHRRPQGFLWKNLGIKNQRKAKNRSSVTSVIPLEKNALKRSTRKRQTIGAVPSQDELQEKRRKMDYSSTDLELDFADSKSDEKNSPEKIFDVIEPSLTLSLGSHRFDWTYPSEFDAVIKKETVEELCLSLLPIQPPDLNSSCETLQDFLRLEDVKAQVFRLDCQRIADRLAKIADCLGATNLVQ